MLRSALQGLAALHERNIIHTARDIKPNNILVDYEEVDGRFSIKKVQIADLEDSAILPPGRFLKGTLCGNQMWRSPESWARSRQGFPSDVFSFGAVCIYVMLDDMALRPLEAELNASDSWRHILRLMVSFFGEDAGFKGLLRWIGEDNPFFERLIAIAGTFNEEKPQVPFGNWRYVDEKFRDLITKMTNLDPTRRITAVEALEHPWLAQND
ncbi:putative Peripheral plasma membrane protein CASK [Glarea lozoyensis 74030]|nr:putative Peripheral plasma membrane protein CASK [Glarea lozoyensis 74030]